MYGNILITPQVKREFNLELPSWFLEEEVKDEKKIQLLQIELDLGEASALALAIEHEDALLIIDEKKGREIAKTIGIRITGILGIILKAKSKGFIDRISPLLEKLKKAGFRMSGKLEKKFSLWLENDY